MAPTRMHCTAARAWTEGGAPWAWGGGESSEKPSGSPRGFSLHVHLWSSMARAGRPGVRCFPFAGLTRALPQAAGPTATAEGKKKEERAHFGKDPRAQCAAHGLRAAVLLLSICSLGVSFVHPRPRQAEARQSQRGT